ncbi:MAG: hypothetical protein RIS44_3309 [Pseudomonadota bacterium]|jgi:outer membrane protein
MKTTAFRLAVLSLSLASGAIMPLAAQAQNSPWLVRLRAVNLDSSNKDSTGLGLSINNRIIPEFDISYFFTPNWATELVLTYPQKQDIRSNGTKIGSFKHLPPTLTAQYHFTGMGAFKPYLGAGVNYTLISSVKFVCVRRTHLDRINDQVLTGAVFGALEVSGGTQRCGRSS